MTRPTDVRFVALIGAQGWELDEFGRGQVIQQRPRQSEPLPKLIEQHGEPFDDVDDAGLDALLERIGGARIVLIARIDHCVRHWEAEPSEWTAFARFPTWMWRNEETRAFVDWLHEHNGRLPHPLRAGFYRLDLYSLYASSRAGGLPDTYPFGL